MDFNSRRHVEWREVGGEERENDLEFPYKTGGTSSVSSLLTTALVTWSVSQSVHSLDSHRNPVQYQVSTNSVSCQNQHIILLEEFVVVLWRTRGDIWEY